MITRRLFGALCLSLSALLANAPAHADTYPSKPIRLVVPWAPGTPGDVAGRIVAEQMGATLGQALVVDNKPGASGTVGMADALRQPADGYTIYLLAAPATLVAPVILSTFKTDIQKSLAPVGLMAWSYNVLVVGANSPYKSPQDIVAAAKAKPGSLSFPSGGNGTPAHLAGELFKQKAGIQAVHVPYNQISMAITDMVSGRLDFMFLTSAAAIPQIAGGKLRALAASGTKRLAALPDVPTMGEQGFPEVVVRSFEMMTVKHGTPPEVVEKLNAALNAAVGQPAVKEKFDGLGLVADPMSPGQARKTLSAEQASLLEFARSISLKAE